MADGGATATGLKELSAAIEQLPQDVTERLRAVAWRTSRAVMARAKSLLKSQLKTDAHALVDGIVVIEEADKHQFVVDSTHPANQPGMLPNWVEYGTRFMSARPYMRPAGDAEGEAYKRESLAAAGDVVDKLGKL